MKITNDFLPKHIALSALNSFPDENWQWWHRYNGKDSIKFGSVDSIRFPKACQVALEQICLKFECPDKAFPDLDYHGGGLHMIPPKGFLGGHFDAEYHPLFKWKRVGSLVFFLNEEWEEDWGGELIVSGEKILPRFNTAVYFNTDRCWHEVKEVTGPEYRKTLAVFYWQKVDFIPDNTYRNANFLNFVENLQVSS